MAGSCAVLLTSALFLVYRFLATVAAIFLLLTAALTPVGVVAAILIEEPLFESLEENGHTVPRRVRD